MRVDAHYHLWRYRAEEYGWLDERMAALRRDFPAGDLVEVVRAAGVDSTVAVEVRRKLEETEWLLEVAAESEGERDAIGGGTAVRVYGLDVGTEEGKR